MSNFYNIPLLHDCFNFKVALYISLYEVIQMSVGISSFAYRRCVVQTTATFLLRSALLRDFTQRRLIVCYRRFGTRLTLEGVTDRFSRNVGNKLPMYAA